MGRIRSRQNRRLKDIRRLRGCKGERALLEGPHLVAEAAAAGLVLEWALATPAFLEAGEGARLAGRLPVGVEEVEPELLAEVTDADSPRGIVALASLPRPAGAASLPRVAAGVYLYLAGLQDPGNLGSVARTAEAAGAAALALAPGSAHPNHPRALRASAGSLLRLPVAVGVDPADLDRRLTGLSPRWLALAPRGGEPLWAADLDGTLVVALGAEGPGLPAALAARADRRVTIPMAAPVESLNVAVAAALVLFEIRRRSAGCPPGPQPV